MDGQASGAVLIGGNPAVSGISRDGVYADPSSVELARAAVLPWMARWVVGTALLGMSLAWA